MPERDWVRACKRGEPSDSRPLASGDFREGEVSSFGMTASPSRARLYPDLIITSWLQACLVSLSVGWGTGARTLGSGGNSTHFKVGLSPAPMATFPAAPPKIPYGGFSPVRLQVPGTAQFSRESSHVGRWLKCDPHIRHLPTQLALAFGIASAGRDPTSMCGASASDDSTWTQRSSLR